MGSTLIHTNTFRLDTKGKQDEGHAPSSSRHDFLSYILSLMRSHSAENGDDLPIIEYNNLKAITFVCEAYLSHINILDQLHPNVEGSGKGSAEEAVHLEALVKEGDLRRFFKRSKSICYPLISTADPHHAFKYSANECLPLSTRTHLLQPDAEKNHLFALPTPERTHISHRVCVVTDSALSPFLPNLYNRFYMISGGCPGPWNQVSHKPELGRAASHYEINNGRGEDGGRADGHHRRSPA